MQFPTRFAPPQIKILLLTLFLTSCAAIVPTSDLSKQALDQSVQIKGKVITVAPMINQVAYEVQDDRGTVWILTKKQPPKLDTEISVTGKVKFESIQAEGQEWGDRYLEED
jgi:RecJ-like exonuclease